jgi:hypothetical protein
MLVHLCGTRGSVPAPGPEFVRYGGNTSCVAITADGADGPSLILDAGTGLRSVSGLLHGRPFRGTILLSHLHWDHVHGLPFFAAGDTPQAQVRVVLPGQGGGLTAEAVLEQDMSPPHFPITPAQLRGSWTFESAEPGPLAAGCFRVLAREIPHKGGRTFGYRVSDGRTTLAYLPDHDPVSLGQAPMAGAPTIAPRSSWPTARMSWCTTRSCWRTSWPAPRRSVTPPPSTPSAWPRRRARGAWCCSTTGRTGRTPSWTRWRPASLWPPCRLPSARTGRH